MPRIQLSSPAAFADGYESIRAELGLPTAFPEPVLGEAFEVSPDRAGRVDLRDLRMLAIDPPGATDLDQAFWLSRTPAGGYHLRYAIADVGAFVRPGGSIDGEARRRGVTLYFPDTRIPLHPRQISEDRGSLLPGVDRPATVWDLRLDSDGELRSTSLGASIVRVSEAISYGEAQRRIEVGADEMLSTLRAVGTVLLEREEARGGISVALPDQEVVARGRGFGLAFDVTTPVERWAAQLSLLTGMAAAEVMVEAGTGVLRTLPDPSVEDLASLRRIAAGLGLTWPRDTEYPAFVRRLRADDAAGTAFLHQAVRTFRGASYEVLTGSVSAGHRHGAIAAHYTHVTAPLRRLVDRYATAITEALLDTGEAPTWALEALDGLPGVMNRARGLQGRIDRAVIDFVEAMVLTDRIGTALTGVVVDADASGGGRVQFTDPAIVADVDLPVDAELGSRIRATPVATEPWRRRVVFEDVSVV